LTWNVASDSTMKPPRVLTPAAHARVEAELYPFAFSGRKSGSSGLGFFLEFDKTVGLSIDIPNSMGLSTPINQAHYSVGVRYRLEKGPTALAFGAGFARRHYIADRSSLPQPNALDTPDVDYVGVSPGLGVTRQVASKVSLFAEAEGLIVLKAGKISTT